jgi:hypothetical protein
MVSTDCDSTNSKSSFLLSTWGRKVSDFDDKMRMYEKSYG